MKKHIKRIICVVMTFVLLCSTSITAFSLYGLNTVTTEVDLLQEGDYVTYDKPDDYYKHSIVSTFDEGTTTVEDVIYNGLLNCESSISLFSFRIPLDDFMVLYSYVINKHPDLFYVSSSVSYRYAKVSNVYYIYDATPMYVMSQSEIDNAKLIFNQGVEKAMSKIDSSMTDLQKALVLHDYMCDLAHYPDISGGTQQIYHSAYGFFYDGNVVCAGYTLAYSYLLSKCGVRSEYVVSEPMEHAWNIVLIDGQWYNVDVTYDDVTAYYSRNTYGAMMHRCFMKSDSVLSDDLGYYHFGAETPGGITASSTLYDNYFWNNIDTNILVIDGDYYYLASGEGNLKSLVKRDINGNEEVQGSATFSSVASTLSGRYYDAENTEHTVTHKDYFSRLVYLDGRFYINSMKSLYSYCNVNGNYIKSTIFSANNYLLGVSVCDNQIVYQLYGSGEYLTLDKLQFWRDNLTHKRGVGYNNYVDMNLDGYINGKDYIMIIKQ